MKKLWTVALACLMLLTLAACVEKTAAPAGERGNNEIAALYDEGYQCEQTVYDESTWKGIFRMEDSWESVKLVTAKMTKAEYEAISAISFEDENADEKTAVALTNFSDVTVEDVTDLLPTQEELDAYVGKTLGDLEEDGFENTGNSNWDGEYTFYYDGPVYCVAVDLADGVKIEDMDDYSANDLRELSIGKVEMMGLSGALLDW